MVTRVCIKSSNQLRRLLLQPSPITRHLTPANETNTSSFGVAYQSCNSFTVYHKHHARRKVPPYSSPFVTIPRSREAHQARSTTGPSDLYVRPSEVAARLQSAATPESAALAHAMPYHTAPQPSQWRQFLACPRPIWLHLRRVIGFRSHEGCMHTSSSPEFAIMKLSNQARRRELVAPP